jgi:hypothetical protein
MTPLICIGQGSGQLAKGLNEVSRALNLQRDDYQTGTIIVVDKFLSSGGKQSSSTRVHLETGNSNESRIVEEVLENLQSVLEESPSGLLKQGVGIISELGPLSALLLHPKFEIDFLALT